MKVLLLLPFVLACARTSPRTTPSHAGQFSQQQRCDMVQAILRHRTKVASASSVSALDEPCIREAIFWHGKPLVEVTIGQPKQPLLAPTDPCPGFWPYSDALLTLYDLPDFRMKIELVQGSDATLLWSYYVVGTRKGDQGTCGPNHGSVEKGDEWITKDTDGD